MVRTMAEGKIGERVYPLVASTAGTSSICHAMMLLKRGLLRPEKCKGDHLEVYKLYHPAEKFS